MTSIILCLAHYCELHGPTPMMVTEAFPTRCESCYDHDAPSTPEDRPHTAAAPQTTASSTAAITDALRSLNFASQRSSSVPASEQEAQSHRAALLRTSAALLSGSAIETPPESPRIGVDPQKQQARRDSSFRKTYDDNVTKRANPCENCALSLPKQSNFKDPRANFQADSRGPTLRTRAPYAKVYGPGGQDSPPNSQSSPPTSDSETEENLEQLRRSATGSTASQSSLASGTSTPQSHTHYLEYISTKEPMFPASFSIVRTSCLRTLSFEALPKTTATNSPPGASPQAPPFSTFSTSPSPSGQLSSGGPIFFGDPVAGYTTAYIFRIPDVHSRGHKRVYAFLALSTTRERLAMKAFTYIAAVFGELAKWIQQLAEAEAEKQADATSPIVGPGGLQSGALPPAVPLKSNAMSSASVADLGASFLTGGSSFSRRMGAGGGPALKARSLPELVGMPDFFIQLHRQFVKLLLELGVRMNN